MHVCMFMYVQVHTCNVEGWWQPWVSFLRYHLPLFGDKDSHWPELVWLAMLTDQQAQGSTCLCHSSHWVYKLRPPSSTLIFMWTLGINLRFLWFQSKYFTGWNICPQPTSAHSLILRAFVSWIPVKIHSEARSKPVERNWASLLNLVFTILWLSDSYWKV